MYSSTNCDKNRGSCVNTLFLNQDKECFCHLPKGPSFPIRVKPLPARSPRPLTCLLPVHRSPFAICYINRAAHYAPFVSGFFQLSITCLRAIHTFGLDSLCFCLFFWVTFHRRDISWLVHSFTSWCTFIYSIFFFQLWTKLLWRFTCRRLRDSMVLVLLDKHPDMGLLGCLVIPNCMLGFKRNCQAGFQWGAVTDLQSYQQRMTVLGAPCFCQQLILSVFLQSLFHWTILVGGLHLHFRNAQWCQVASHRLCAHLVSTCEVSVQIFYPFHFLNWNVYFLIIDVCKLFNILFKTSVSLNIQVFSFNLWLVSLCS